nr:DUF4365 domain-containing protein [Oscillatoria sp. HE19RPO]
MMIQKQENEIKNLIEYKETSNLNSLFEVSFGTNGQITKFILDPQLQEPISFLKTTVYSILEQLKTSWNQYYSNSSVGNLLEEETEEVSVGNLLEEETEEVTLETQEELGYIRVRLVAALANFAYQQSTKRQDHASIDAEIHNASTGDVLSVQIKTIKSPVYNGNFLKYTLKIKNYNDLRKRKNQRF